MKKINPYRIRKIIILSLIVFLIGLFVISLIIQNWNDPHWLLIASISLNVFTFVMIYLSSYKNTKIELNNDKLVYRLVNMKNDEVISIDENTEITKDWKGIYFKNNTDSKMISLNYMWNMESNKLFDELKNYYKK